MDFSSNSLEKTELKLPTEVNDDYVVSEISTNQQYAFQGFQASL
jgi:hypothetical protein